MGDREPPLEQFQSPDRRDISQEQIETSEQVARGGNAIVSVVELSDKESPARIAVKEPLAKGTLDDDEVHRFLSEAERWETVDRNERNRDRWRRSEHVVGVVDTGDRLPWIAMEYMDGGTLADRLAATDGGLPIKEALWIGECLCRGVAIAHNMGIVHLDLKPANILFRSTRDGVWDLPKVADWGLSRVLAEQSGTVDGLSPAYAAPEQFDADEFGEPDTLTDIYQVGAVLYEILTGGPIASGGRFQAMQVAMSLGSVAEPSTERPEIDAAVDAAVMTALERRKIGRYSAIEVMTNALHALRVGGPLPPIVSERLDESSRRSPPAGGTEASRTDASTPSQPVADDDQAADEPSDTSSPDLVDRVTEYDKPGSYSASPGDHIGATSTSSNPTSNEHQPADGPSCDEHGSDEESLVNRVMVYDNYRFFSASDGDHTGVNTDETGEDQS